MSADAARKRAAAGFGARGFTPQQKAALVVAALGPEAAKPIMEKIGDKHLRAFAQAYAELRNVPKEDLLAVIAEFVGEIGGGDDGFQGGFEGARALISQIKTPEDTTRLLDDIDAPGARTVWQKLEKANDQNFAGWLADQHPQTVSVVLSRLDSDKASAILALLPPELSKQCVMRLARPMQVRREALRVLEEAIERDFLSPARRASKAARPGEAIGAMLNNMPEEKRAAMLAFIQAETPDVYEDVRAFILTFKDIPERVPANAIAKIVREVDVDVFLKAAKYGRQNAPAAVEFIFKNISQRMGQQYEEQMAAMKQYTLVEAEAAQAQIMSAVRRLVSKGEFELNRIAKEGGEEEVYV